MVIADDFIQGDNHSILSSLSGLGAGQVLEWEAVTATSDRVIATLSKNVGP